MNRYNILLKLLNILISIPPQLRNNNDKRDNIYGLELLVMITDPSFFMPGCMDGVTFLQEYLHMLFEDIPIALGNQMWYFTQAL